MDEILVFRLKSLLNYFQKPLRQFQEYLIAQELNLTDIVIDFELNYDLIKETTCFSPEQDKLIIKFINEIKLFSNLYYNGEEIIISDVAIENWYIIQKVSKEILNSFQFNSTTIDQNYQTKQYRLNVFRKK